MGGVNSTILKAAEADAAAVKESITRKCRSFVVSIETTSSIVDVELTELRREIAGLVRGFREKNYANDLGLLHVGALVQGIEEHADRHKEAIRLMLEMFTASQERFEDVVTDALSLDSDNMTTDAHAAHELRLLIEDIVRDFEKSIAALGCEDALVRTLPENAERVLFKLGDSIITQTKENVINECKNMAYEDIDNILCNEMCDGTFSDPESARMLLQNFISVYMLAKETMENLPFQQRSQIERAQDELSEYIEDLIRRIQMVYAYHFDEASMRMIMDLGDEDDDVIEAEEEEEEEEKQVVVKSKKTPVKAAKTPKKAPAAKASTAAAAAVSTPKKAAPKKSAKSATPATPQTTGKRKRNLPERLRDEDTVEVSIPGSLVKASSKRKR